MAVNTVIVNVAGCLGGPVAGLIAQGWKDWSWTPLAGAKTLTYDDVLFALSGTLRFVAVAVFLPFIHEPTARSAMQALQFILAAARGALCDWLVHPARNALRFIDGRAGIEA